MNLQLTQTRTTLLQQVTRTLETVADDGQNAAVRRRALMYAEAIDDADEPDALFRFGPKLRACLELLDVDIPLRAGMSARRATTTTIAA